MEVQTYAYDVAAAVAADGYSTNAPSCKGLASLDIFLNVASSDAEWAGITQLDTTVEVSADGANWVTAQTAAGADVKMTFTGDGSAYVTLNPVPGFYLRLKHDVTGDTDTLTITARGIGRA